MTKANIAYQYRLYPTTEQCDLFARTFGCCRKVYNLMLADKQTHYKETGKSITVTPAMYKKDYPFLKEVDSLALANEQLHLQTAYKNFFRDKRIGFPKFKSRKNDSHSYTTNHVNGNIEMTARGIKLPKAGVVKARIHRFAPDSYQLKSVTVSEKRDGSFYASVLYEYELMIEPLKAVVTHIGLDYKSDGLYVDSNGQSCEMPHFYREAQAKLKKAQRRLSRMVKGSANYQKQKLKIARLSRRVASQRKDFLHKRSAEITNQYDLVSVESLNMRGMAQSLKLGKATLDNAYGMFLSMIEYKQNRKGHHFIRVDKFYPSSQLCRCGYQNPATKDLSVRMITCPICGHTYDRDHNAAVNIDQEGLRLIAA